MSYTTATDPDGCQAIWTEQYHCVATRDGDVIHVDHAHADQAWHVLTRVLAPDEATICQIERHLSIYSDAVTPHEHVEAVLAALAGTSAQARHTADDAAGGA